MNEVNGVLMVDKPSGWTSHDICAFIRSRFEIKKVGHAGTLDPLATGLLIILLGKATKHSMVLSACDKEYRGVMELGVKTDSHDREGKVLETASWDHVSLEVIRQKALQFTGEIFQVPPMVSALKYKGTRLYKLARKGLSVPRQERRVMVHELSIKSQEGPFAHFSACVSKGTYLRTLVNDLGEALGCFATLAELRRLRCGEFKLEDSLTIEALRQLAFQQLRNRVIPYWFSVPDVSYPKS